MHYSLQQAQSIEERRDSPTIRLRNWNSFAKAVLLEQFLSKLHQSAEIEHGCLPPISVLDVGCGKGGDLKKFVNCGVSEYCGVDISRKSLEVHVDRTALMVADTKRARHGQLGRSGMSFREVSLVCADTWRENLAPVWDSSKHATARLDSLQEAWFHLVSSQMACHYAFESEASLDTMLRNVSERLCVGGYFVGTLPDAQRIIEVQRLELEKTGRLRAGNDVFKIEFEPAQWARVANNLQQWSSDESHVNADLFGITYRYTLVDAVDDCSEPLAHFGTFKRMAAKYGLVLQGMPRPLTDIVEEARGDGPDARAEAGRLRRIYFYKGGMNCKDESAAQESEALRLYLSFAFRKESRK